MGREEKREGKNEGAEKIFKILMRIGMIMSKK